MSKKKRARLFPCTDAGNAEMFAALYGAKVRYDHKQRRWLIWSATRNRWTEDKQVKVRILAKKAARQRAKAALRIGSEDERKQKIGWAFQSEGRYRIDAALELAKSEAPISDDGNGWDSDPWLFAVANGIVDLHTGKLRSAIQHDRMTKFSPVIFDAAARCPRWEQFLNEIFESDSELIGYLQTVVGYTLTGCVSEQCLFACYGTGANGKSTLLGVLHHIMGDYGVNLPFSALELTGRSGIPNDVMMLLGARFATAIETREGVTLNEARIKALTGGDAITGRRLYQEPITFRPTHKFWLAFNHRPRIADDSDAMWRRIRLIPFLHTFDSQQADKGLAEKLKAEAPGILNWALAGCLAWQKDGLQTPAAVERATAEYENESDPLAPFFEDCCEQDVAFQVPKVELKNAYEAWCRANKERPVSRITFAEKMKNRDFGEGSTGSVRYWTGLQLKRADKTDTTKGCFQDFPKEQPSMEKSWKEGQVASVPSVSIVQVPLDDFYEEPESEAAV
jgi:putative DNA primase/helicase